MKKPVIILLHITYWTLYCLLLLMLYGLTRLNEKVPHNGYGLLMVLAQSALLPAVIAFYSCNTFLFSLFLGKRKILYFILSGVIISMCTVVPAEILLYFEIKGAIWNFENCLGIGLFITGNALMNGGMGTVMRAFVEWYEDIKVKEDLSKKNFETELALVKSQINPHFLFNTINNIDMLILKEPQKASTYLNKLSDIMRFMLYETKTEKVSLSKELAYIEKYIELQRIRSTNHAYVKFEIEGFSEDILVEPLLFIPFIENAFKHTEDKATNNAIRISFLITKEKINFECFNIRTKTQDLKTEHSGLGNELITKRLALLYPGKHKMEIGDREDAYLVKIELKI
ncbi:hypothetical protein CNR22_11990 [Sphingobacteriaceae bacterium]|nr:hypothetical protein CNR22_11990 [Sphingobacteriaceae bacterium]